MTLQLRPTFSESWYRVKDLKPRLRSAAQISRQHYRGERWYVVRDPAGNQFHRLSDIAYSFVGLLDGTRTVGQCWELVGGQLADEAPTQPEIIQILSQLYAANLIETNIAPDAQVLLRRHKKQQQRKLQGRLMNLLFPRIPLWDPDRFLKSWMPLVGPLISRLGAVVWLLVVGLAAFVVIPRIDEFASETGTLLQSGTVEMWLALAGTFVLTKFLHEMGHAFACRRFGGECHEIGIMFLVLMPCPYVDASTAWGFSSKWRRIFVAAGGMIAELFVAALAAIVWAVSGDGAVHQVAYYTMLIASVSTVVFNANPLLRYDGYYILSDWLEIPNLQQKSRDYTLGLVRRYVFGVKSQQPLPPTLGQRLWLVVYSVASTVYRIFIGFAIMLMVIYQLPEAAQIIGYFLAAGAVATFFVIPIGKLFKYLTTDPELHRKRTRAWAFTLAVATAAVVLIGGIPFPNAVRAQGVSEPLQRARATVRSPGWVDEVLVRDGQHVKAGDVLVTLRNPETETDLTMARLELQRAKILLDAARSSSAGEADIAQQAYDRGVAQVDKYERDVSDLQVVAPNDGQVIAPELDRMAGLFLKRGQPVAEVADDAMIETFVSVEQGDYERILADDDPQVEVRLAGDTSVKLQAVKIDGSDIDPVRFGVAATSDVRSSAMTLAGGGTLAPDQRDPNKLAADLFQMRVLLSNPPRKDGSGERRFLAGQRAYVRVKLEDEPLARQWWRQFLQLIQTQRTAQAANPK